MRREMMRGEETTGAGMIDGVGVSGKGESGVSVDPTGGRGGRFVEQATVSNANKTRKIF